jgi:hypothetical protein
MTAVRISAKARDRFTEGRTTLCGCALPEPIMVNATRMPPQSDAPA